MKIIKIFKFQFFIIIHEYTVLMVSYLYQKNGINIISKKIDINII
jgi:hypothetical protein